MKNKIKFIDLFAGLGGTRIGLEQACKSLNIKPICVLTSEIKPHAISNYKENFKGSEVNGDITKIDEKDIPDFDILLAGFPCQSFSSAGARRGLQDTRGTLFFEIQRILKFKKPDYFLLENVEGLLNHDKKDKKKKYGRTFEIIYEILLNLGYKVSFKVFNAIDFGIPQDRKRIFIVGHRKKSVNLDNIKKSKIYTLSHILENIAVKEQTNFQNLLTNAYKKDLSALFGKSIKDKRGGANNIHSWDLGIKGNVTKIQKNILNKILTERRRKIWAEKKNIKWMDGMSLNLDEIASFICKNDLFSQSITKKQLKVELEKLVNMGYLSKEHPKELIQSEKNGNTFSFRREDENHKIGYNIVVGKLSFEISKILDPNGFAPTLVATDMDRIQLIDNNKLRKISIREGLRLFGFPESYKVNLPPRKAYNLLGESIVIPIVKKIVKEILVT